MSHQINLIDDVLTIRITGKVDNQDIQRETLQQFANRTKPLTVILDLTMAQAFDRNLKAIFYRLFQHRSIENLGICIGNPALELDTRELVAALGHFRTVSTAQTEHELLAIFGLVDMPTQPRKLTGMLSFLKKPTEQQQ